MEDKLILEARHIFNVTLASKLRVVSDIFNTRATEYNGITFSSCTSVETSNSHRFNKKSVKEFRRQAASQGDDFSRGQGCNVTLTSRRAVIED